ncbi:hypothetical protein ACGFNP_38890 [Nonomuraea sp. NPDC049269]
MAQACFGEIGGELSVHAGDVAYDQARKEAALVCREYVRSRP